MTAEQKRQHWQTHIDLWQTTELTKNAYCIEDNIAKSSSCYRLKQLNYAASEQPPSKFIPLDFVSAQIDTLSIAGLRIELFVSALEQALPVVLRTIREAR